MIVIMTLKIISEIIEDKIMIIIKIIAIEVVIAGGVEVHGITITIEIIITTIIGNIMTTIKITIINTIISSIIKTIKITTTTTIISNNMITINNSNKTRNSLNSNNNSFEEVTNNNNSIKWSIMHSYNKINNT